MSSIGAELAIVQAGGDASQMLDPFLKEKNHAERLRQAVVNAVGNAEYHRLGGLLGGLATLTVTNKLLWETGVGHLVADKSLWGLSADEAVSKRAAKLSEEWKQAWARGSAVRKADSKNKATHPFASLKASRFSEVVASLSDEATEALDAAEPATVKAAAIALALNGFSRMEHLCGVHDKEAEVITRVPGVLAMVKRMIVAASGKAAVKRRRTAAALAESQVLAVVPASSSSQATTPTILPTEASQPASSSAQALSTRIRDMDVDTVHNTIGKAMETWGVPQDGKHSGPASTIERLASARNQGMPVCDLLAAKAATLRMESKRKSLPHVATGLKAWHTFATTVLGYDEKQTLPPKTGYDVECFVAVFQRAATAQNYVGFVRWACENLRLPLTWDTDTLRATLKGARKRDLRVTGGQQHAQALLTEQLVAKVVTTADALEMQDFSCFVLVAWEFLLRVQSECMPMQRGEAIQATCMPPSAHSGIWVEGGGTLALRLAQRKNRPQGSLIRRPCTCASVGRQFCVVHRLAPYLRKKRIGEQLWSFNHSQALASLRRLLTLNAAPDVSKFTLKAFRAGKATALAASGKSLGAILQAGEWRSSAFMSYVDTDVVDAAQILDQTLGASDDEE